MIDVEKLEQYRENNRIEAKKALGGLPHSIWETYSAFANTLGGVLLLGVEEYADKTFHTVDLPDPERLVQEFWALVNDKRKASVNLLTPSDVRIETVNGNRIILIHVPRAERFDKPVYVDGDPNTGSYWRSGEGDHRCTPEQLEAMRRDAAVRTQDMRLIRSMELSALETESLGSYRRRLAGRSAGQARESQTGEEFLTDIGAAAADSDGTVRPTLAGVLMFGTYADIRRCCPDFSLSLREGKAPSMPFEGNVYEYYSAAMERLTKRFPGDASFADAVGEALGNCLINADYYSRAGVEVSAEPDRIVMTNPGFFRIPVDDAMGGGRSDPRNGELMRMFNRMGVGESAGGGIPGIFNTWRLRGWSEPSIAQLIGPGRVRLTLPLGESPVRGGRLRGSGEAAVRRAARRQLIVDHLTEHISADIEELSALVGLRPSGTVRLLRELVREDVVAVRGRGSERRYSLRA